MPGYRPRLRAGLVLRPPERPGAPPRLYDPHSGNALPLREPWQQAALPLLDGTRDAEAVHHALASASGGAVAPPSLEAVRCLLQSARYLRLTEDTDPGALARLEQARRDPAGHAARVPWRVLRGGRFACQRSGNCCRSYALGPLGPEDVAALQRLQRLAERFPALGERPPVRTFANPDAPGGLEHHLQQAEHGGCVFLLEDNRCGIHALYGPEHKPAMCQLFPTSAVLTLEAKFAFDRAECHTYGTSAFGGESYPDRVRRLLPLLEQQASRQLFHPQIALDEALAIDFAYFLVFEQHVVAVLGEPCGTIAEALLALRAANAHLLAAVAHSDDPAARPEQVLAAVAAVPPRARYASEPLAAGERRAGLGALAALLREMYAACERTILRSGHPGMLRKHGEGIEAARAAAVLCHLEASGQGLQALPRGDPAAERIRAAAALPLSLAAPRCDRRLRRLLQDVVFSKDYALCPSWLHACARLVALLVLVLVGARLAAVRAGRERPADADLDRAQVQALRLLRLPLLAELPLRLAQLRAICASPALPLGTAGAAPPPG
ncbi:MAG: hypothetical protein KatS3mg102_1790 [Planctomycetota bacterium]|nr:MAG: hypothetical protein KatS3mg102_1790 [Planctomycetota bacterium]